MPSPQPPNTNTSFQPRQWDVFCRVIDNFGDVGVCWRLVRGLASQGHHCRLWLDDHSALAWMAPEVQADGLGHAGVHVLPWHATNDWATITPGDVVIEAFGCDLPEPFVARMQREKPPAWINLEYFSAEPYVERSHGLPSPVMHGAGKGLCKYFFFPGVNAKTGGLMRSETAAVVLANNAERQACLQQLGLSGIHLSEQDRLVSVFCYPYAPLADCLDVLQAASTANTLSTCHVLLTTGARQALPPGWAAAPRLHLHDLPALSQTQYDQLLHVCDLNIVRGEDSAVSALWTGKPHLWHIYHQDDGAHAPKLQAFMAHWMSAWPNDLAQAVQRLSFDFNTLSNHQHADLINLWQSPLWAAWQQHSRQSSHLQQQDTDLLTRLQDFVIKKSL